MSTYVVGDLQGCLDPLRELLDVVDFEAGRDRLWLVGDLVNRGAQSTEVLRFVHDLGDSATAVLGNHDLYLLAVAAGAPAKAKESDTIEAVLTAPDAVALLDWLRQLPLMHVEGESVLVHAGLLPEWSVAQARALAAEVEAELRSDGWRGYLQHMFGNQPARWDGELRGWDRHRIVINAMTRMRYLNSDGAMELKSKGPPELAGEGLLPWFAAADAAWRTHTVFCGHWSALGLRDMGQVVALDSGCVWGGQLSAFRVEDRAVFQVSCETCGISRGED